MELGNVLEIVVHMVRGTVVGKALGIVVGMVLGIVVSMALRIWWVLFLVISRIVIVKMVPPSIIVSVRERIIVVPLYPLWSITHGSC